MDCRDELTTVAVSNRGALIIATQPRVARARICDKARECSTQQVLKARRCTTQSTQMHWDGHSRGGGRLTYWHYCYIASHTSLRALGRRLHAV
jgi:hypothetical protein